MKNETQAKAILAYLREGKSLTPIEALNLFGCLRLSARIKDLRDQGNDIGKVMVVVSGGKRVAEYHLVEH